MPNLDKAKAARARTQLAGTEASMLAVQCWTILTTQSTVSDLAAHVKPEDLSKLADARDLLTDLCAAAKEKHEKKRQ